MKNFIFKSPQDFHKIIFNKLDMVLAELRHQRQEHVLLLSMLNKLVTNGNLQKQVDDYFEDDENNIPEKEQEKDLD